MNFSFRPFFAYFFRFAQFGLELYHSYDSSHLAHSRSKCDWGGVLQSSIPSMPNVGKSICSQWAGPEIKREREICSLCWQGENVQKGREWAGQLCQQIMGWVEVDVIKAKDPEQQPLRSEEQQGYRLRSFI